MLEKQFLKKLKIKEIPKMKKIIALILVLTLCTFAFAACGGKDTDETPDNNQGNTNTENTPVEKNYTVAIAVETVVSGLKVSNYAVVLVLDEANKIAAVRLDCAETTVVLEEGALKSATVTSKVELGDNYNMTSGSFAKQTKAFEDAIVGKTAEEVANLDMTLVSGCTMPNSPANFKAVIAKAFATANKTTFKTAETITVGLAISMKVSGTKASADYAGTVLAGGKVVSAILDSNEVAFTIDGENVTANNYAGTKADKGDAYMMPAGNWLNQAKAFSASAVGKTVAELENLETVSDALAQAGCTMQNTTAGYKTTLVKAANNAR